MHIFSNSVLRSSSLYKSPSTLRCDRHDYTQQLQVSSLVRMSSTFFSTVSSPSPPLKQPRHRPSLPTILSSSFFVPILPAKTYPAPHPIQPSAPFIDKAVGDQIMPTDEMIEATATKKRRHSSCASMSSGDGVKTGENGAGTDDKAFLPLVAAQHSR